MISFSSLIIYVLVLLFLWIRPERDNVIVLVILLLLIKDILSLVELKPMKRLIYNFSLLNRHYEAKKIWILYYISVINRIYLFPILFIAYFLYSFILFTQIWSLHESIWFYIINPVVFLWLLFLSWVLIPYRFNDDAVYCEQESSLKITHIYVWITIFLSILCTYLLHMQIQDINFLGFVVSIWMWIFIFLTWIYLVDIDKL